MDSIADADLIAFLVDCKACVVSGESVGTLI